jgi:hypothetical protein
MTESLRLIKDHKSEIIIGLKMIIVLKPNMTVKELISKIEAI